MYYRSMARSRRKLCRHVGTVESDPATNRLVKRTFAFAMPRGTTGFNPALAWSYNELSQISQQFETPKLPNICA
jgi:hypothetical protein